VNISEVAMAAAITVSVAGVSYVALNVEDMSGNAQRVAGQATCRAVETAVVAYAAQHDTVPTTIAQIRPLVRGDISAYRIVAGRPAGPGC
jgi:hypothetical protein